MKGYSWSKEDFREILYSKYIIMEEKLQCLWIGEQDTDYTLCEWFEDVLPTLYKQNDVRYFYNQYKWDWSQVSCTIFAAAGMLSDLMDYEFSESELKEMDEMSYERWRVRGQWWYVQSAVKCVADWWNKKMKDKVAYYRISKYSDEIIDSVLDKLYTLDTNYNGNKKYNEDKRDWVLDWTDFGASTYGHSVDIISNNWKRSVKDSWSTNQIYELKHKISEISCYGSFLYFYTKVKEDALEDVKRLNEMKTLTERMIEDNSAMWHLTNDWDYKKKLHEMNEAHRKKLKDIEEQLKKYN